MFETSFIEIDSKKYRSNLRFLRHAFGTTSELCLVIKGNAYGHGDKEIMNLGIEQGVTSFAVFSAEEALRLSDIRRHATRLAIMGDTDFAQVAWAIENGIEFYVNNPETLKVAAIQSAKINKKANIHIEFETGMNRLGFDRNEHDFLKQALKASAGHFEVKGFCTHLAGAESMANFPRIRSQISTFDDICDDYSNHGIAPEQRHAACSAAAIRFPETRYQMIRIGILQYGFWPSHETYIEHITGTESRFDPLQRVITWKSRIMSTKNVHAGQYVGYGSSYLANSDKKLAIIPVGYSDGFARSLSNKGRVLIKGQQAAVVGTVNMNALAVDVTHISDAQIGDEVVLIGTQAEHTITVSSFSDFSEQLNYELLSRLPHKIPRSVI